MKALIVEDESTSRLVLNKFLEPFAEVHEAEDGEDAIKLFKNALTELVPFDFVALDIMLPDMEGHEVLKAMRKAENELGIYGDGGAKIVMTTASSRKDDILNAFNAQCESYLVKPIDKEQFLSTLKLLKLIE